jgi:hypothetical protein
MVTFFVTNTVYKILRPINTDVNFHTRMFRMFSGKKRSLAHFYNLLVQIMQTVDIIRLYSKYKLYST